MEWTGTDTTGTAGTFIRIYDYQTVFSLINGTLDPTGLDTLWVITVITQSRNIVHLNLGDSPSYILIQFQPELADIGLRFGIRSPIIGYMLIFTSDLAVITAITD
jgi:hypothetical protein